MSKLLPQRRIWLYLIGIRSSFATIAQEITIVFGERDFGIVDRHAGFGPEPSALCCEWPGPPSPSLCLSRRDGILRNTRASRLGSPESATPARSLLRYSRRGSRFDLAGSTSSGWPPFPLRLRSPPT